MKSRIGAVLAAVLAMGTGFAEAGTAAAQTTGTETFHGMIVASGRSGGRDILATVIVAHGVFRGAGRIVEVDSRPGDPDNVNRDDLVFRAGTMHIVVTNLGAQFSVNPRSCILTGSITQTGEIEGGTGRFAEAMGSFTGSVEVRAQLRRNPDRTCSEEQAPRFEKDTIAATGTMTF